MFSTVPGQINIRFSDVYLKRFKLFAEKNRSKNEVENNILFTKEYQNAKLEHSSLKLFQIYTVQLRKLSTFLTCISVLKPVNTCSCFGRVINDFGKLFSARPYKLNAGD